MAGILYGCRRGDCLFTLALEEKNMGTDDVVIGRVIVHAGTRYGGKAQQDHDYYRNSGLDTLVDRTNKFLPQKDFSADVSENKKNKLTRKDAIHIENIQWVNKKKKKCLLINSTCLADIIKKLITGNVSPFKLLYKVFLHDINNPRITPVARFCVVATGVDPHHKKKTWTFIKAIINDVEFVLPNSFLRDCSGAFLKKNSI